MLRILSSYLVLIYNYNQGRPKRFVRGLVRCGLLTKISQWRPCSSTKLSFPSADPAPRGMLNSSRRVARGMMPNMESCWWRWRAPNHM